jgi:NADPH:quinone reductase
MKEALVGKGRSYPPIVNSAPTDTGAGPTVRIVDSPLPSFGPEQLLIRVVVSGSNPKDWKMPAFRGGESNTGDDIAGVVEKVGEHVSEFKPGDRVAAFHEMMTAGGSFAEYAVAWQHSTFHLAPETTFEDAACIPLAAMTAAIGLYVDQGLPAPWLPLPDGEELPLIVYGAAGAVGAYAVQLAVKSNVHPIICVAGSSDYVETLIDRSKGDTIVDYRQGDEATVEGLRKAIGERKVLHVFDAVSEHNSVENVAQVVANGAKMNLVLGGNKSEVPAGITKVVTGVGRVHRDLKDFAYVYYRLFGKGLRDGWLRGHRPTVVPGGLGGIEKAMADLQAGRAHAQTFVFRVEETEGAGKEKL